MHLFAYLTRIGAALVFAAALFVTSNAEAALSAAAPRDCKGSGNTRAYLMKASTTIYYGGLVMLDSDGVALPAAASASNHNVVGIAQTTKTSGASGNYWIGVTDNVICKFAGTTLGQEDVGALVYAEDDETVDEVPATGEPIAGILYQYSSASVGWVYVSTTITTGVGAVGSLSAVKAITGVTSLTTADCGKTITVSADADDDEVTLPEASTASGCVYTFSYIGADAGCQLEISPLDSDADGIEGGCYETATDTVVYFSGTADADVELTKGSSLTGDWIQIRQCGDALWCVTGCQGIWAQGA
jgi:hypothetical protein